MENRVPRDASAPAPAPAPASASASASEDGLWSWLEDRDAYFVGALADSGASGSSIGPEDWRVAECKEAMRPMYVLTGSGTTTVDVRGDFPNTGGLISSAPLLNACPESLLSVGDTCDKYGCGYTQDPGNTGARLWHPDYGRDGVAEMVKDGVLFRLPELTEPVPWAQGNICIAAQNLIGMVAATLPKWYAGHVSQGHPFRPDRDS